MTRSIDPILVSPAPYTDVPSTLSLPIREPVSLVSVTITGAPPLLKFVQQTIARIVPAMGAGPERRTSRVCIPSAGFTQGLKQPPVIEGGFRHAEFALQDLP